MNIWIVNPFDELPGETDIRHRYWALADTLSDQGHTVTWWSSNFSHRTKDYRRPACSTKPQEDYRRPACSNLKFSLRLVPTSPYARNVSFARLRNHRQYAQRFKKLASASIESGELPPPDRIVVSLPPLGTASAAFAIRKRFGGEVIVDIMDAWPETFYRLFPGQLGRYLMWPLKRSAIGAFRGADRISAVAQVYIDLAKSHAPDKPTHLCYHGIDKEDEGQKTKSKGPNLSDSGQSSPAPHPLKIAYIGALERSYDLETAIQAIQQLSNEGNAVELHIAGAGTQEAALRNLVTRLWTAESKCPVHFHGLLSRTDLHKLLSDCHLGLIPMTQDSHVGIPYKLGDYCAAGLPVISSLDGECREFLETKKAGSYYEPGVVQSLVSVLSDYSRGERDISAEGINSLALAKQWFDRNQTYADLSGFISGE
ncbi:MAG: glycosyltransferase [Puniceicoccaceae bacterium]